MVRLSIGKKQLFFHEKNINVTGGTLTLQKVGSIITHLKIYKGDASHYNLSRCWLISLQSVYNAGWKKGHSENVLFPYGDRQSRPGFRVRSIMQQNPFFYERIASIKLRWVIGFFCIQLCIWVWWKRQNRRKKRKGNIRAVTVLTKHASNRIGTSIYWLLNITGGV